MLLVSLIPGLTVGNKMYQPGEIFEVVEGDLTWNSYGFSEDITDEQIKMKFKETEEFRRPTEEELKKAYGEGKVDLDQMNDTQKKIIKAAIRSKAAELRSLSEEMQKETNEFEEEEAKKK